MQFFNEVWEHYKQPKFCAELLQKVTTVIFMTGATIIVTQILKKDEKP